MFPGRLLESLTAETAENAEQSASNSPLRSLR